MTALNLAVSTTQITPCLKGPLNVNLSGHPHPHHSVTLTVSLSYTENFFVIKKESERIYFIEGWAWCGSLICRLLEAHILLGWVGQVGSHNGLGR